MEKAEELVKSSPLAEEQKQHFLEQLKNGGPTKEFFDAFEAALKSEREKVEAELAEDAKFVEEADAAIDAAVAEYEAEMKVLDEELDNANAQLQKDLDAADADEARKTMAQS